MLTLHLQSDNLRTKKVYKGQLHFVDLAGSERVKKSEVTGAAFDEAAAINKSLSALGDVIQALSQKKDHVPFRNSSLTTLLKNSLGGNSKTVMISNIAPTASTLTETISSLNFATRVKKSRDGYRAAIGRRCRTYQQGQGSQGEDGRPRRQVQGKNCTDASSEFRPWAKGQITWPRRFDAKEMRGMLQNELAERWSFATYLSRESLSCWHSNIIFLPVVQCSRHG